LDFEWAGGHGAAGVVAGGDPVTILGTGDATSGNGCEAETLDIAGTFWTQALDAGSCDSARIWFDVFSGAVGADVIATTGKRFAVVRIVSPVDVFVGDVVGVGPRFSFGDQVSVEIVHVVPIVGVVGVISIIGVNAVVASVSVNDVVFVAVTSFVTFASSVATEVNVAVAAVVAGAAVVAVEVIVDVVAILGIVAVTGIVAIAADVVAFAVVVIVSAIAIVAVVGVVGVVAAVAVVAGVAVVAVVAFIAAVAGLFAVVALVVTFCVCSDTVCLAVCEMFRCLKNLILTLATMKTKVQTMAR
jgi:hypothetical protein